MSNFWQKKLGQGSPAQPPQGGPQQHAPASSRPWWDQSEPVQSQAVSGPPAGSQVLYDAQGNAVLVGPNGQVMATHGNPGDLSPEEIAAHTKSARKGKSTESCPACGSGDYSSIGSVFTKNGQVETKRCFDCGYPVEQRFSGMKGMTSGEADGAARQVAHGGTQNNFSVTTSAPAFAAEQGGPGR